MLRTNKANSCKQASIVDNLRIKRRSQKLVNSFGKQMVLLFTDKHFLTSN